MQNTSSGKELFDYVQKLASIPDNHAHAELRGRVAAVLGAPDPRLPAAILQAGAARCYTVGPDMAESPNANIVAVRVDALGAGVPEVDVAFFDSRSYQGFDHVNGITALVAQMKRILKPGGLMFCVLKSGTADHYFDVYNPIVRSKTVSLPSQEYLFRNLLGDCAIRMLDWIPSAEPLETVRFFRLAVKRPTLLLILGRSQSGKTSLARDLQAFDAQMHVSNDYIYCELVQMHKKGWSAEIPTELIDQIGDGSGQACGNFNRALEREPQLLRVYLEWVVRLLPRDKRIISMDFDLVDDAQVKLTKSILIEAGYSVWVVCR